MEAQSPAPCWSNILKKEPEASLPDHQAAAASGCGVPVTSCKSTQGLAVAIVDANAIIEGGQSLGNSADRFVSVSEVISEIRDPTSRHSLNFLPFSVDILEPSSEALKQVINFSRATGDLHSLSDVDLKLIALTYTLEAQIHGTQHLRVNPPPIHSVNVKRLPEKDMPGWGSNVPNLEEWEALEHVVGDGTDSTSKILPLKDLNLNVLSSGQHGGDDDSIGKGGESYTSGEVDVNRQPRKFPPVKREVRIEGKKMVANGIDASQGQFVEDAGNWQPAVSRSTRRRYLRRKSRCEMSEASSEKDFHKDLMENGENEKYDDTQCPELIPAESLGEVPLGESKLIEGNDRCEEISSILHHMRLEEESLQAFREDGEKHIPAGCLDSSELKETSASCDDDKIDLDGEKDVETCSEGQEKLASQNCESIGTPNMDDNSSEQSWTIRSLSQSSVACITSDYAMQNVLLQMGLRLVAPGGRQIQELHRWVLKCHACFKVTMDIGRIFCPSCGNGGTLRKVAITVNENGIVLAERRSRVSVRGTKFSLPLPQGGRDAITKNPILREDQIPQKFLHPKTKKKNKQDEDIFLSDSIFLHHTDKKAPLRPPVRKALAVFSGKRNPNDNHFARVKH